MSFIETKVSGKPKFKYLLFLTTIFITSITGVLFLNNAQIRHTQLTATEFRLFGFDYPKEDFRLFEFRSGEYQFHLYEFHYGKQVNQVPFGYIYVPRNLGKHSFIFRHLEMGVLEVSTGSSLFPSYVFETSFEIYNAHGIDVLENSIRIGIGEKDILLVYQAGAISMILNEIDDIEEFLEPLQFTSQAIIISVERIK